MARFNLKNLRKVELEGHNISIKSHTGVQLWGTWMIAEM